MREEGEREEEVVYCMRDEWWWRKITRGGD
jgi:hypothetical protein